MSLFPGRSSRALSNVYDSGGTLSGSMTPCVYCHRVPSSVRMFLRITSRFSAVGSAQYLRIGPQASPKSFFISIAILRNNCRDPLWARHRQAKAHRRAVVEHIERVPFELKGVCERQHGVRQRIERVFVITLLGDLSEPEPRKIRSNDSVTISQARDQLSKLKRRCWKTVQQ